MFQVFASVADDVVPAAICTNACSNLNDFSTAAAQAMSVYSSLQPYCPFSSFITLKGKWLYGERWRKRGVGRCWNLKEYQKIACQQSLHWSTERENDKQKRQKLLWIDIQQLFPFGNIIHPRRGKMAIAAYPTQPKSRESVFRTPPKKETPQRHEEITYQHH